jgi:cytoskeletal protein RodZ
LKRKIKGKKEPPPQPEKAEDLYPILSKKPLFNLSREASYMVFFIVWFLGFVIIFLRYYQ